MYIIEQNFDKKTVEKNETPQYGQIFRTIRATVKKSRPTQVWSQNQLHSGFGHTIKVFREGQDIMTPPGTVKISRPPQVRIEKTSQSKNGQKVKATPDTTSKSSSFLLGSEKQNPSRHVQNIKISPGMIKNYQNPSIHGRMRTLLDWDLS